MGKTVIVNSLGTMIGWTKFTCRILGRDLVGVRKVSYTDSLDITNEKGAGRMDIGEGEGNYKAEFSLELTLEEMTALQASLPPGARIQDIAMFSAISQYEYKGKIYKDVMEGCRFTNRGVDVKQGDKTVATDQKMKISHINWNV